MDLREVFSSLRLFYRRRALFLLLAVTIMTAVIAGGYLLPKKYRADSTVFIEKNVINDLVKGIAVTPDMDERIRVLKYALLSRDLINKTLLDLDLDLQGKSAAELQGMVSALQQRTEIQVRGKELFTVSITDPDPQFAQQYINTLVGRYVEANISGKREETYGANRFLDEQLAHFKQKLDEAEDAIIRFRREQGVDISSSEENLLADLMVYKREIEKIQLEAETERARVGSLQAQLKEVAPTVAIFSERQKEDRLAGVEARLRQLLLTYTDNYPEVIRLRLEAEELKKRLAEEKVSPDPAAGPVTAEMTTLNPVHQEVRQKLMTAQNEISALDRKVARLKQLSTEREAELQNIPENKKAIGMLVQERDSLRKIYEELLMRLGQAEVSKQMEIGDKTTTFRIVDPAILPRRPVSPNMLKVIVLALAAGLGGAAVAILLLENTRSSIRDANQLPGLGLEVLTVIPRMLDPVQVAKTRRRDLFAYTGTALYLCGVAGLAAFEMFKKLA
ncbi:MAG: chain length-determining protein [Desulfuromonadales bacterium]|nr:chain length-determining protein [Desulfuromonadales bacterium]